jgi:hypothetical protein
VAARSNAPLFTQFNAVKHTAGSQRYVAVQCSVHTAYRMLSARAAPPPPSHRSWRRVATHLNHVTTQPKSLNVHRQRVPMAAGASATAFQAWFTYAVGSPTILVLVFMAIGALVYVWRVYGGGARVAASDGMVAVVSALAKCGTSETSASDALAAMEELVSSGEGEAGPSAEVLKSFADARAPEALAGVATRFRSNSEVRCRRMQRLRGAHTHTHTHTLLHTR